MRHYRPRRGRRVYPAAPPPILRSAVHWRADYLPLLRIASRVLVSVAVVVHLALATVFPGGWNGLFEIDARGDLPYLTYFPITDAFGFPGGQVHKGFIQYKIYAQDGDIHHGRFPDPRIRPDLRFDRWVGAGDLLSEDRPDLHAVLLDYILAQLKSAPIRLELYSRQWNNGHGGPDDSPGENGLRYRLTPLGSHDGLSRLWTPMPAKDLQ